MRFGTQALAVEGTEGQNGQITANKYASQNNIPNSGQ